jgi:hypothetical protein
MASVFLRIAGTIFILAMSRAVNSAAVSAVSEQSHSPCCRQLPRPAAVLSEKKQATMVWQTSLRPNMVADARREAIAPDVPPAPQNSDLNPTANSLWITNGGFLQYRALPTAEQFRFQSFHLSPGDEDRPLFAWLPGWRLEANRGLFHKFRNQASVLAFAYSDIFETRGNPDKGGHGPAILFRLDLGKTRKRASQVGRRES